jgi:hypothetical protein
MLIAENVDDIKSCGLDSVDEMIANHIDFNGLPVRTKRMMRNGHLDFASRNTILPIFHSIILWGLGVEE